MWEALELDGLEGMSQHERMDSALGPIQYQAVVRFSLDELLRQHVRAGAVVVLHDFELFYELGMPLLPKDG